MGSKAPDAFRTISEVSDILDTPPHVLRFWESKFIQLKPVKRAGGRRYYRPSDLELLGGIKRLLHEDGMTIRGVQKMLRERGVKHVAGLAPPIDLEAWGPGAIEAEEWTGPDAAHPAAADTKPPPPQPDVGAMPDDSGERAPERPQEPAETPAAPAAPADQASPPAPRPEPGSAPTADAAAPEPAPAVESLGEGDRDKADESVPDATGAPPRPERPAESPDGHPAPEATAPRQATHAPPADDEPEPAGAPGAEPVSEVPETESATAEAPVAPDPEAASEPEPTGPLVATALRRLHPPLPEDRASALRVALARIETLHARLREAVDSAPG